MSLREGTDSIAFEAEATELLDSLARARKKLGDLPGVLNGELERFRDRVDRLIRESEVDNWRQVRIFLRDVDAIAADLAKAAKEKRVAPKHLYILDSSLRKARKRDFYGARKAWRKLDKVAEQIAEIRRLQNAYRDSYRGVEARIRSLRADIDRLSRIPKPSTSPEGASAFVASVEAFSEATGLAYRDFLATARADRAVPLLLDAATKRGVGVPAPPHGADPEPLLHLLADEDPSREPLRSRSFYGLLELPGYSDAKLTHTMGDGRPIRQALDAAWSWLKAIRDDERRSLQIQWSEDVTILKRRLPALVAFLESLGGRNDAVDRGKDLEASVASGEFGTLQSAARLYGVHGKEAERKWRGELEREIEAMRKEAAALAASLKKFQDPSKLEA